MLAAACGRFVKSQYNENHSSLSNRYRRSNIDVGLRSGTTSGLSCTARVCTAALSGPNGDSAKRTTCALRGSNRRSPYAGLYLDRRCLVLGRWPPRLARWLLVSTTARPLLGRASLGTRWQWLAFQGRSLGTASPLIG